MLKTINFCFCAVFISIFFSACMFTERPYTEVNYYDLALPKPIVIENVRLRIIGLNTSEAVKYKMVYHDGNRIVIDEYNKWVQGPSLLLTRYLQSAFLQKGCSLTSPEFLLEGTIFIFRININDDKVSLGVKYNIRKSTTSASDTILRNSKVFTVKAKSKKREDYVAAMNECAKQLAQKIASDVKTIRDCPKNKKNEQK